MPWGLASHLLGHFIILDPSTSLAPSQEVMSKADPSLGTSAAPKRERGRNVPIRNGVRVGGWGVGISPGRGAACQRP